MVQVIYPAGNREWFEYDENGNRTAYIDGRLNRTEYSYDRYNRLVEVKDAQGGITRYFYDRWGNMTRMVNPLGHVFRYDYDEVDRLIQETDSLGYVKKYRYDAVGNRIYSRDPNGTESIYEYYPNNLVRKISMSKGTETKTLEYWYDEAGYKRRVRDDGVELFYNTFAGKYIPDPFGRIRRETRIIDGRSFTVDYTYDVMGRVTGIKYPSGQEVTYQYNSLGELTGMPGYLSGAPTYDQGGLLTGLTAANGITMTRAYDENARLQKLGYYTDPLAALKEYQYTYDGANNIIQRNEDQFQYDALNQLVFARLEGSFEIGPENDDQRQGRTLEDYYGAKQLEFTTLPEILELDYAAGSIGVDLRGEFPVTRVELTPESPVHRLQPRNLMLYVSNDNHNYTEVKDWEITTGAGGEMIITFAAPVTTRFIKVQCQFDDRDRDYLPVNRAEFKHRPEELIKVYYTVSSRYEEYTYDASGNRVQERITLRMTETRNYSYYPNSNRLLTNGVYGYLYDANGNLIRKGTSYTVTGDGIELEEEGEYWEYRYDLLNRLTEVKKNGATVARYWYDETGLRIKKESGDGTIYYVFNLEGQVLYEEESQGYVEYIYLLGRHFARVDGYRTAITEERITYFYHTDHLGSTVLVTDETGATVWSTEYTPFGSLTFEEGKLKRAVKFTGKDLDEDTGLYYFNARGMTRVSVGSYPRIRLRMG